MWLLSRSSRTDPAKGQVFVNREEAEHRKVLTAERGRMVLIKVPGCRVASETQHRNQNLQAVAAAGTLLGFSWRTE